MPSISDGKESKKDTYDNDTSDTRHEGLRLWPTLAVPLCDQAIAGDTGDDTRLRLRMQPAALVSGTVDDCEVHFAPRNETMVETIAFVSVYRGSNNCRDSSVLRYEFRPSVKGKPHFLTLLQRFCWKKSGCALGAAGIM